VHYLPMQSDRMYSSWMKESDECSLSYQQKVTPTEGRTLVRLPDL
jgi:hypothetical protein